MRDYWMSYKWKWGLTIRDKLLSSWVKCWRVFELLKNQELFDESVKKVTQMIKSFFFQQQKIIIKK